MTATTPPAIRPKVRAAILTSLQAGVVPRTGHQHIQVGRFQELTALLGDIMCVADGGSSFRLVIGDYGAGKTFFLMVVRAMALETQLVTLHADLTPDRRLQGSGGHARSLYTELLHNAATRAVPDGGAIQGIVERFVTGAIDEATANASTPEAVINARLAELKLLVGGYDFATVITAYWRGHSEGNDQLQSDAVRWLRGEFSTKTDARKALGVREIVDDTNWYNQLKLLAVFVRLAGYGGIMVCLDEMVNLYKLAHSGARNANYDMLLSILNDSLQGSASGLGWVLGGTPEFLLDPRRGLYSYQALQSRLAENSFAIGGLVDYTGPVLRLANLSAEELFLLLSNVRNVYAGGDATQYAVDDDGIRAFMHHCEDQLGSNYFRTPRETIMPFLNILSVLAQNPDANLTDLIGATPITLSVPSALAPLPEDVPAEDVLHAGSLAAASPGPGAPAAPPADGAVPAVVGAVPADETPGAGGPSSGLANFIL